MRNVLKFSQNWNNKLSCPYFTTMRLKDDNRFHIGETYDIVLKDQLLCHADIVDITHFFLKDINNFVAGLDTGYPAKQCQVMIATMYKNYNIDWDKRMLSLLLLKKLDPKTIHPNTSSPAES